MMINVELDVYSGRPNPSWQLSQTEADDLLALIPIIQNQTAIKAVENDALGYRGFIVTIKNGGKDLPNVIKVHAGIITLADKSFYDNSFLEKKLIHQATKKGFGNLVNGL